MAKTQISFSVLSLKDDLRTLNSAISGSTSAISETNVQMIIPVPGNKSSIYVDLGYLANIRHSVGSASGLRTTTRALRCGREES
jgi:ribonuclease PH